jgi:hypothetical protein
MKLHILVTRHSTLLLFLVLLSSCSKPGNGAWIPTRCSIIYSTNTVELNRSLLVVSDFGVNVHVFIKPDGSVREMLIVDHFNRKFTSVTNIGGTIHNNSTNRLSWYLNTKEHFDSVFDSLSK